MNQHQPLVTFIIPCFNQANFLIESIGSIFLSYSGPKDIIVINDFSTMVRTNNILAELKHIFPEIRIINHEKNQGLAATRNHGIRESKGEFIQFLDADDLLLPNKIDLQLQHFNITKDLAVSISNYLFSDGELVDFQKPEPSIGDFKLEADDFLFKWERGLSIPIHCALFRRSVLLENFFVESLTAKEDWVFWSRLSQQQYKLAFMNVLGVIYRQHNQAMTKNKVVEMASMWIKAASIINDNLQHNDNITFLEKAIEWFSLHYLYAISLDSKSKLPDGNIKTQTNTEKQIVFPTLNLPISSATPTIKFSVVIPIYNHYEFLFPCIESVLNQDFQNFEIIGIDDCSPDRRVKELLNYLEQNIPNFKMIYNSENKGISESTNLGASLAKGEYLVFLDCDDMLPSNAISVTNKIITKYPLYDYYFTDKNEIDVDGNFIRRANYGGYSDISFSGNIGDDLLLGMVASHLKVIKKESYSNAGGCSVELEGVQDYDLALKISEYGKLKYISQPLYLHRQHKESITSSQSTSQFRKMNIARRNHCDKLFPKKMDRKAFLDHFQAKFFLKTCNIYEDFKNINIHIFNSENISVSDLISHVKNGDFCVFDIRGEYKPEWKYFIREYNSFLDLIITNSPELSVSIIGYLWDQNILTISY